MDLITLLAIAILICMVVWAARSFNFPQPVQWIIGAVVLIVLLVFLLNLTGIGTGLHTHLTR
jgi:predicted Na+-dependent transporter